MRSEEEEETEIATKTRPASSRIASEREVRTRTRKGVEERDRRSENGRRERERRKRREEDRRREGVAEIVRARWDENLPLCETETGF